MSTFKQTELWKLLQRKRDTSDTADLVASVVMPILSRVELLLRSAGTSPPDFTLHDDKHSFRVAEWMHSIIPTDVWSELSDYELALLLMSAYLHDIGMNPELKQVSSVQDYLLSGNAEVIPIDELDVLKTWLDENTQFQISHSQPLTLAALKDVRRAAALYCRYRHNDWSEKWIRDHVECAMLYNEFVNDLITVCRSHHEGFDRLSSSDFDPRILPSGDVIHRRYLACVLRVADILDLDPERTPVVIFTHRDVPNASKIFWHKDHAVHVRIAQSTVHLTAEPQNAIVHRAIVETSNSIEDELRVCYRLSALKPFDFNLAVPNTSFPHRWDLKPYLHTTIRPHQAKYEYIDGSFRPNADKVLQLLGSPELYATPFSAIRELLQNAFDSVRERIARERIARNILGNDLNELANNYEVTITVERDERGYVLVCRDDGSGMNKAIIDQHFLVSGNFDRPDLRRLAGRCRDKGIGLERTGQFGIGVLSYFMLADSVIVQTRRGIATGDDEGHGWQFETEGVGTFGELRRTSMNREGTVVSLRLKNHVVGNVREWHDNLVAYLRKTLIRVPCQFKVSASREISDKSWSCRAGWTRSDSDLTEIGFQWLPSQGDYVLSQTSGGLVPSAKSRHAHSMAENLTTLWQRICSCVRWQTSDDIYVGNLGICRIHIPVFHLSHGTSPVFLDDSDGEVIKPLDSLEYGSHDTAWATGIPDSVRFSWFGMAINVSERRIDYDSIGRSYDYTMVELDFLSQGHGTLALSREWLQVTDDGKLWEFRSQLRDHIIGFKMEVAAKHLNSRYAALWFTHDAEEAAENTPTHWLCNSHETDESIGGMRWSSLPSTVTECVTFVPHNSLKLASGPLFEWSPVSYWCASSGRHLTIPWAPNRCALLTNGSPIAMVPIWTEFKSPVQSRFGHITRELERGVACEFPPQWRNIVIVKTPRYTFDLWNPECTVTRNITRDGIRWVQNELSNDNKESRKIENTLADALQDIGKAAAIFVRCITSPETWVAMLERFPHFMQGMWDMLAPGMTEIIYVKQAIDKGLLNTTVYIYSPTDGRFQNDLTAIPLPDDDWNVVVV